MKKLLFVFAALFALNVFAQVKQTISRSVITFKIKNMGVNIGGSIGGLQADINFDPANLAASTIVATADANTLDTDNGLRDTHLKSADYFNVDRYPKVTLKSNSFKHKSRDNYSGSFNVTIKDKTKTVEVPFTYTANGTTGHFQGSFKLNRLDFGIGDKSMILADEATVFMDVETTK